MSRVSNRNRNRTLVITEGNHEKNKLLKLILLAFPEINISEKNIIMYESNIYSLYAKIVNEYGANWKEQDVDLPKCVAKWKNLGVKLEKQDFTNVILVFDYERQDTNFSESKICELQQYFSDINDVGQLYINYPMVESYLDIDLNHADDYEFKTYPSNFQKGAEYKTKVMKNPICEEVFLFRGLITHIEDLTGNRLLAENTAKTILSKCGTIDLQKEFYAVFNTIMSQKEATTLSFQYSALLRKMGYDTQMKSYFSHIRNRFMIITENNIRKSVAIQGGNYHIDKELLDDFYYDEMDFTTILNTQNDDSRDLLTGFINILNTSIFIISNYKFFWRELKSSL